MLPRYVRGVSAAASLPTEDLLMEQYHACRNTVRGALKELTTRGLVYTLHGKGTFVSERVTPMVITLTSDPKTGRGGGERLVYTAEVTASGRSPVMEDPEVGIRRAASAIAQSLQIPEETEVIVRHQNGYVDGLPWSLQTSYYPRSLAALALQAAFRASRRVIATRSNRQEIIKLDADRIAPGWHRFQGSISKFVRILQPSY